MRQRRILERGERSYSSVIQGSNGQSVDLATADIDISAITLADQELNAKLLEESKKASEKFNNRRGRKFTPMQKEAAVENGMEESSPESSPELPKEGVSHKSIAEEERVGAEGDSDPEEVKGISRKDSDDIDVKADIIKAIGPITGDRPPKSSLSSSKIRQEKKTKRPTFKQPMPELAEDTEFETCEDTGPTSPLLSNGTLEAMSEGCKDVCSVDSAAECSIQPEGTVKWEGGEGENKQRKSSILSDSLLKALGLKKGDGDPNTSLTEQEVEEKYNSLTFAFKTDRMTLEHRFKLQQHQRNVVEQNLQEEMREHTTVVQSLERRCAEDEIARTDINKLKQHIDVMQYAFVKLASKAEGYGAVQQEERLSRAAEIMVSHVENIKRLLDRERAELAEAKRLLKDNKILMRGNSTNSLGLHDDTEGSRLRRSSTLTSPSMKHSLHGFVRQKIMRKSTVTSDPTDLDEAGRRRASVAAVLGFGSNASGQTTHATNHNRALSVPVAIGTKSLQFMRKDGRGRFASLANAALMDRSSMGPGLLGGRSILDTHKEKEGEETNRGGTSPRLGMPDKPKKKLSISLSSPALRVSEHPMSPTRSLSNESQTSFSKSPVPSPTGSASPCPSPTTPEPASSPEGEPEVPQERSKQEMEIFQEGFEQGVRSQISQELSDLREQQRVLCENLEEIMEAADDEEEEDTLKKSDKQPVIRWLQQYSRNIPWSRASRLGRLFLTGALFLLALISVVWTLLPVERCQGGLIIRSDLWESFKTILGPYTGLSNPLPPPT
ncbi:uncharacterized protein [Diadema antillarum]|uniref:uncharacterized protein n=1 Tax=Diadema antillarum TaxID=105358 RepID=UPI003A8C7650